MTRTRIFAAAAVAATIAILGGTLNANAQAVDILIPIDDIERGPAGSVIQLAQVQVDPALQGVPCTLEITAQNQGSVHPGNDIVFDSGPTSKAFKNVEGSAFQIYSETVSVVLGPQIILSLIMGPDKVFSAGFHAIIDCEAPTPTVPVTTVPATTTTTTTTTTTIPATTTTTTTPATTTPATTLPAATIPDTTTTTTTPATTTPPTTLPTATVPDSSTPVDTPPIATLPAPTVPPAATTMPPTVLPDTGSNASSTVLYALASLVGGLGLLMVARRRTSLG